MKIRSVCALLLALAGAVTPAAAQMTGSDGESFITAMKEGDGRKALELLDKPGSTVINYRGQEGSAAIHIAVRNRDGIWLGYLLGRGADPNLGDKDGNTPLILASRLGFSEGASRLLMRRALVDKTNRLGETPLIAAVQARQVAITRMLLEAGANPDKADHASGYSARDYAKRDSRTADLLRLIETVKPKKAQMVGPVKP